MMPSSDANTKSLLQSLDTMNFHKRIMEQNVDMKHIMELNVEEGVM